MDSITTTTTAIPLTPILADYAPAATSLFNNMKLPAAVVTAGMISLGFATGFPELPRETDANRHIFPLHLRARCEGLKRLHIVVALVAVTSELITVLWAAVEVNQLTEKQFAWSVSVWDLIQRDCDLAWSAVNSHFALGIIGFVAMLALRAYVMLIAAEASVELMIGAGSGTGAALCLMISIVNRGVESGGGGDDRYGTTMMDLFGHYAVLLAQEATNGVSPGPLQLAAIVLEVTSLFFMMNVLLFDTGKTVYAVEDLVEEGGDETGTIGDLGEEEELCPVIDVLDIDSVFATTTTTTTTAESAINGKQERGAVIMIVSDINSNDSSNSNSNNSNSNININNNSNNKKGGDQQIITTRTATKVERKKLAECLAIEEEKEQKQRDVDEEEDDRRRRDSDNTSVGIV
jgi:hypothetical protein